MKKRIATILVAALLAACDKSADQKSIEAKVSQLEVRVQALEHVPQPWIVWKRQQVGPIGYTPFQAVGGFNSKEQCIAAARDDIQHLPNVTPLEILASDRDQSAPFHINSGDGFYEIVCLPQGAQAGIPRAQ